MTKSRVNEIDLLRFFAALSVVIFHYSFRGYAADSMSVMPYPLLAPIAKYGYLGVELFFMISGFVILMTAANGDIRKFVISRVVRLYPAFWACCTITFVSILLIGGDRYSATITQYLINMTMLSGFFGVPAIDSVYWSLFVEMRFYALVALVLLIGRIHQAQAFLLAWLICSIVIEILSLGKLRYLLIVDYAPYFIAGAMCFLIWEKGVSPTRVGAIMVSWLMALYESVDFVPAFEEHYQTEINNYIVVAIVTALFVVMFMVSLGRTGFVGNKRWVFLGMLTYPLYLIHQTVGFMVFNMAYPEADPHLLLWLTIIFMLVIAYFVNIAIERRLSLPLRNVMNYLLEKISQKIKRTKPAEKLLG